MNLENAGLNNVKLFSFYFFVRGGGTRFCRPSTMLLHCSKILDWTPNMLKLESKVLIMASEALHDLAVDSLISFPVFVVLAHYTSPTLIF